MLAAAATVLGSAGPAAAGSGFGQLIVDPGTAAPGQTVSILGVCPTNGSVLTGVHSAAFVGGAASITPGSENFTGTATISGMAAPGTYAVTAVCGPGSPSVDIVVSAGGAMPTSAPATSQPPRTEPAMPRPSHSSPPAMSGGSTRTGGSPTPTGGTTPAPSASATMAGSLGGPTGTTPAPAVTSTGVIRVGLAGDTGSMSVVLTPVLLTAAFALACGIGFLIRRRRRHSPGSHS